MAKGSTDVMETVEVPVEDASGAATSGDVAGGKVKQKRASAMVAEFDFDGALPESELKRRVPVRKSKWNDKLGALYDATAAGRVPRNPDGSLKFVRVGQFGNGNGARVQAKTFEAVETTAANFEFKSTTRDDGSDLWARVRETVTAGAEDSAPAE